MRSSLVVTLVALLVVPVLLPLPADAAGVDPLSATKIQREQAGARFTRGHQFFDRKQYEEALAEFRASLDIVASPNARLFVARSLRETGRIVEAYVEFGRTAVEGKELAREDSRYAKAGESAAAERAELEPKLAFVSVSVEHAHQDTKLKVGGEEIRRAAWGEQTPLMPGDTEVIVETPGRAPVKKVVTTKAGGKASLSVDAEGGGENAPASPVQERPAEAESPKDNRGLRPYAYVAGGVGAVGLVMFAVEGLNASSTYNNLNNTCHGACPASMADQVSSGKTQQTIANVGLAIGILGVGAGVTLFVISQPKKKDAPPAASFFVSPSFVGLRGTL